jgi:carboxymethylenebutenolidase
MPHEFKTYDNVGHSFMNNHQTFAFKKLGGASPMRAKYDATAA